jgi:predicted secreted protein
MTKKCVIIAVSFLYFVAGAAVPQSLKSVYQVDAKQSVVDIALPENPTTGYRWYLVDYPSEFIKSVEYHYQSPQQSQPGVGGVGHFLVFLDAKAFKAPVRLPVVLTQARSWEAEKGELQTIYLVTSGAQSSS